MSEDGYIHLTDDVIKNSVQSRKAIFDKDGESHYDNISAFTKLSILSTFWYPIFLTFIL